MFVFEYMEGPNVGPVISQRRFQWDPTVLSQMHCGEKQLFEKKCTDNEAAVVQAVGVIICRDPLS